MNARLLLVPLVFALAACGQATSPPSAAPRAPAATPAATPTPDRTLIAVTRDGSAGTTTAGLFTLDGRQVASITTAGLPGLGGGMVTFVDHGVLKGLTRDGTVEALGPIGSTGAVVSPDAQHWMWSTFSSAGVNATSSRLVMGTRGGPDRVIAQQTAVGQALAPYSWTAAGPIYQSAAMGIGGYILFGDFVRGPTYRFDPATGQVSTVLAGTACTLADLAADGTIACYQNSTRALAVTAPGGRTVAVPLPTPAFNQWGAVSFGPGSSSAKLVVGGATGAGADGGQERYEMDLVDVGARTLRPFGPAGLRPAPGPWSWLPDGSLLAYRPAGAFGGDPGVYVVAPDGTARRVLPSGTPLGVIG